MLISLGPLARSPGPASIPYHGLMPYLGVNVDHVATVRNARGGTLPSPLAAALACQQAGAHGITIHLREDRRHITDADLFAIRAALAIPLNLEMACTEEMVAIALEAKPHEVCLVPERREERTTEGGLDLFGQAVKLREATATLKAAGIAVSYFIEASDAAVEQAAELGATHVELHTGPYAHAWRHDPRPLQALHEAAERAIGSGLFLNAGHGLDLWNLGPVAAMPGMGVLNIGHALVGHALFVGMRAAVGDYLKAIAEAKPLAEGVEPR